MESILECTRTKRTKQLWKLVTMTLDNNYTVYIIDMDFVHLELLELLV